jgi:hypothetical protein
MGTKGQIAANMCPLYVYIHNHTTYIQNIQRFKLLCVGPKISPNADDLFMPS